MRQEILRIHNFNSQTWATFWKSMEIIFSYFNGDQKMKNKNCYLKGDNWIVWPETTQNNSLPLHENIAQFYQHNEFN